jgi:hypothetical protein
VQNFNMKKIFLLLVCMQALCDVSFAQVMVKTKNISTANDFVELIKKAHNFDKFHKQKAVVFEIQTITDGKLKAFATVTTLTGSGKIKFQTTDGKTVIFDGKKTWLTPAKADYSGARFDIFTYQYFFMAPFKVSEKGTKWALLTDKIYDFNDYACAKLTFQSQTGDSPNDWYVVHRNKATNYLEAMSYIVTYGGKPVAEAEKKAGAIIYSDWKAVEGVMFATTWKFKNWTEEKGFFNNRGEISIKNIRFITPNDSTFTVPQDCKEVGL